MPCTVLFYWFMDTKILKLSYFSLWVQRQVKLTPCLWNGVERPCFLFARKFLPETLNKLLRLFPNYTSIEAEWQPQHGFFGRLKPLHSTPFISISSLASVVVKQVVPCQMQADRATEGEEMANFGMIILFELFIFMFTLWGQRPWGTLSCTVWDFCPSGFSFSNFYLIQILF